MVLRIQWLTLPSRDDQKQEERIGTSAQALAISSRWLIRAASACLPSRMRHSWKPCKLQTFSRCWQARCGVQAEIGAIDSLRFLDAPLLE
jgi:hypothetical protein